jgi:hypothetical protein
MARLRDVTAKNVHFGLQAHAGDRSRNEDDAGPRQARARAGQRMTTKRFWKWNVPATTRYM